MKPGYRTSEFWFTLVSFIFSGLFLLGIIKEDDTKEELIGIVTHGVESIILIGGQLTIFYKYIGSRNRAKQEYEENKRRKYDEIHQELEDYVGVDTDEEKININEATLGELIRLPHIGPQVAKNILEYREANGLFTTLEQIISVNGIGEITYRKIEKNITI